jgi:hypothetical protein
VGFTGFPEGAGTDRPADGPAEEDGPAAAASADAGSPFSRSESPTPASVPQTMTAHVAAITRGIDCRYFACPGPNRAIRPSTTMTMLTTKSRSLRARVATWATLANTPSSCGIAVAPAAVATTPAMAVLAGAAPARPDR